MTRELLRYYPVITEKYFSLWGYLVNGYEFLILELLQLTPGVIIPSLRQYTQANNSVILVENKLHFQLISNQWLWFILQSNLAMDALTIKLVLNSISSLSINYDNYIKGLVLKRSRNTGNNITAMHLQHCQLNGVQLYTVFRQITSQLFQYITISADSNNTTGNGSNGNTTQL